jgi:4-diphosphocytidyl-2-C-methyl-D-erythritol kinase
VPGAGVSTGDAFGWWDRDSSRRSSLRRPPSRPSPWSWLPDSELANDLERPVVARRPEVGAALRALRRQGALHAAMSGSGCAVFGVFERRADAVSAARRLGAWNRVIVTRTLARERYAALARPALG